ncbi:glycosyltransferase family 4 protein [Mesorhizobium sp.]|uniref:glycosyltransferase family 4 protein n=1 Tax=Mesorhizobium sp. TaxID=1871066 RepID=UPI0012088120|nr:glycosyltransferase family 4 protein [Mesorhizobium sp.]TIN26419.1 MAG: glycosyltransferase family 4 protein [Mesorhizobium sp.]
MTRVIVAMLGARRHYAVPRLLHEAGLLERFYTDSYIANKPWLQRMLKMIPASLRPGEVRRWLGRSDASLPPEKVTSFERLGLWYAAARRFARGRADAERVFEKAAARFSAHIGGRGLKEADLFWGFDGASLELLRTAKAMGMRCILEQTILPGRLIHRLMREEEARWPGWNRRPDSIGVESFFLRNKREEEEWALADRIVAGSDFVRSGLIELGVPTEKVSVVPYGVDPCRFSGLPLDYKGSDKGALKVLFVGEVGLRKGVPDLLHALNHLEVGAVDLRLAGAIELNEDRLKPWQNRAAFLGAVPRSEMGDLYRWADVFVLPSIVEGSAGVVYEAVMSGVPVITTPNAGSIVRDGVDGFVVPIRDQKALAQAIGRYAEDRAILARHRAATRESRTMVGLDRYKADLVRVVNDLSDSVITANSKVNAG